MNVERHDEPLADAQCGDCGSREVVETVTDRGPRVPPTHRAKCQVCGHRGPVREFVAAFECAERTPETQAAFEARVERSRDCQADAELGQGACDP